MIDRIKGKWQKFRAEYPNILLGVIFVILWIFIRPIEILANKWSTRGDKNNG